MHYSSFLELAPLLPGNNHDTGNRKNVALSATSECDGDVSFH